MHAHETQPATPQPHTSAPKANPFAPLAFDTAGFGQEMRDVVSNPFPRRPHEVDMGVAIARKPAEPTTRLEPETRPGSTPWPQFSFYAPDHPAASPQTQVQRHEEAGDEKPFSREAAPEKIQAKAIDSQPAPANSAPQPGFSPTLPQRSPTWMWQPYVSPQPVLQEAQPEAETQPSESNWLKFDLYAAGQTPPNPPRGVGVQAKLSIGRPDDAYEQEADRVAEQVMSMAPPAMPNVQRQTEAEVQTKCEACEEEESIQRTVNEASQIIESENQLIAIQRRVRGPHGWGLAGGPFIPIGIACWLRSGTYNDRFADDVLRRIEYDEETRQWNVNEGRDRGDWAQAMFDAWGHCYIAACLGRRVPEHETSAAGTFYEILHEAFSHATHGIIEHDSLTQDLYNQAVGRDIGLHQPDGDLYEICFNAMMQGRLDLTLAGVARGRALVPRAGGSTGTRVQRRETDTSVAGGTNLETQLNQSKGGGSPLPPEVRSFMEPRFGTDFSQVRVHTGAESVQMNQAVGAKAFAHQQDIYYGAGESPRKDELTAHELTHVVQQTGGMKLKQKPNSYKLDRPTEATPLQAKSIAQTIRPSHRSALQPQVSLEALEATSDSLQAKAFSQTPTSFLNRTAQTDLTVEAESEIQAKTLPDQDSAFLAQPLTMEGKTIQAKSLTLTPGAPAIQRGVWDSVRSGAQSVAEGVSGAVSGGLDAVRQRLLQPVAQLASRMPGYPLLTVILGRDPVTGTAVERNATNLIQGILSFVPGGNQMFQNLQESRALENAFSWLNEQISGLNLTWDAIRGLFQSAWESLSAGDLLNPGAAFDRICNIFADPIQRIRNFASAVGQKILEFIFEGAIRLAGGSADQVMGIIRRAGGVFTSIIRDPIGFVGNLVQAVKGGFQRFAGNILTHLQGGLMGWLFGALAGAGLQMPQSFDLKGVVSIVLQVIGATYQRLRGMLARRIGEQRVARLEQVFSFLQTLATEGLAGAWQQIMEFAGNLQEMVIGGIREWVMSSIVQAAVTRLVSMFNPAGAVVQAALAIYNTVMFFIERAEQIAALTNSVFESIGSIASGNIGGAIAFVEQAMARSLPVIISFMARLLGLGNVAGQIRNIIGRVQGAVERAIDRLVNWIVTRARGLMGRGERRSTATPNSQATQTDSRTREQKDQDLNAAIHQAETFLASPNAGSGSIQNQITGLKNRYRLSKLELRYRQNGVFQVHGEVNPTRDEEFTSPLISQITTLLPRVRNAIASRSNSDPNKQTLNEELSQIQQTYEQTLSGLGAEGIQGFLAFQELFSIRRRAEALEARVQNAATAPTAAETAIDHDALAARLGYEHIADPPFNSHGQSVYKRSQDRFISPDVDQHRGGVWKMFDGRGRRLGTYNADLSQRIGN